MRERMVAAGEMGVRTSGSERQQQAQRHGLHRCLGRAARAAVLQLNIRRQKSVFRHYGQFGSIQTSESDRQASVSVLLEAERRVRCVSSQVLQHAKCLLAHSAVRLHHERQQSASAMGVYLRFFSFARTAVETSGV